MSRLIGIVCLCAGFLLCAGCNQGTDAVGGGEAGGGEAGSGTGGAAAPDDAAAPDET